MLSGKQIRPGDLGHRHRFERLAYKRLLARPQNSVRRNETEREFKTSRPQRDHRAGILKVHLSYGPIVQQLLKRFNRGSTQIIKGLAHITGGGFVDNIPRVLPTNCNAVIRKGSWPVLPLFQILQENGRVPEAEIVPGF